MGVALRAKRFGQRLLALAFVSFVVTTSFASQSISDDRSAPGRAAYERAERASAGLHFAEALAAYEEAIRIEPSAAYVRVARARIADLRAHAEGDFVPLTRLESARRHASITRDEIEELARDADRFPPGRVRSETQLVVAEAYWHRFGVPDLAANALEKALSDTSADRLTRALALSELVALERERDRLDAAARAVSRYPDLAPNLYAEVQRLVRRVWLGQVALGIVCVVLLVGAAGVLRAIVGLRREAEAVLREAVRSSSMAFALYIGGVAAMLVKWHGEGDVRPFLWLGLGVFAIDVAARGWRVGFVDERIGVRIGRATTCGVAIVAVAFLALQYADAVYLETLGL